MFAFYRPVLLILLLSIGITLSIAQPANDGCVNAINIPNVNNFCSANGGGTSVNATDDVATTGGFGAAGCWGTGAVQDVWFKFTAIAPDVSITINGNQGSPTGGSLNRPQVALYSGSCGGTINELVCASAPAGQNIIQIYRGGLTIGQTYLIRVDGFNANRGTFQYCVNNYFPVPTPNGDCPTGVVLCDNSSFSVPDVSGAGSVATEMNNAACFNYTAATGNVESSSTWYVFTFASSGTFNFNITPSNSNDDIDFALFRLPNGAGNCNGKVTVRCMASSCTGSTGLNASSSDTDEPPGCNWPQDNYVSQVNVTAGQTYALAINNFTSTGNGFTITFGGTAITSGGGFVGPDAVINDSDADDQICIGESITYTDASTPPPSGTITSWTWNFGADATPATSTQRNPPVVTYSTPGVKTVSLTVKSDRGCLVTSTKSITVGSSALGVSIAANANPVCAGANVTFTATPVNAGASPGYQWYLNGNPVGINASTYSNPALSNNDQVRVVLSASGACITGSPASSNTVTMTVNARPSVTVNSSSICGGTTATLTAGGASTYTWSGGLPNGATVTTPVLNTNTAYTVTGTDANGCTNTATSTITILAKPNVTVNSPAICTGQTATLTAGGALTYTWSGGLPNGATVTTPVLSSNTSYTVTGTDASGCSNTATATVTVRALPNVTVNSPGICTGTSATLTAGGASTYTWSGGLPNGATVSTPVLSGNTSYTVTGTDANGCSNTATATVTVNPLPNVTVNSPSICAGQTANLTANGATSYTWTGGLPAGANVTTPVLNSTTSYTVTGSNGGCSNTATATVTVNPLPNVTVNSPAICAGQTATLTANGASTYTWTGGLPNGASVTTPVLNSNISYTVTGTAANGCINTATANIRVNALPNVTVNSPGICVGATATLTAAGASTYTWTGGLPNGATVTTPILNANTSYTVTGTDVNGCVNTATASITVNPKPSIIVNTPVICAGQTATLTANGALTYTWSGGLPNSSSVNTPALNSTTSYTVTGTDAIGCSNTAVATVTVNPKPNVSVNSPSICAGQTAALTASGASTYTWSGGLAAGATATTPVLNSTTSYTVTGTDANACTNTATATVTVNALPLITVNAPSICEGNTASLTASGASAYTWSGGLPNGATVTTPVLNATTSYTVTGTDVNGCSKSANTTVTVNPNKTTSLVQSICQGETYTVGTQSFSAGGNYSVSLKTSAGCDSIVNLDLTVNPVKSTNVRQTICEGQTVTIGGQTFPSSGVYSVRLQTSLGCDSTVVLNLTVNPQLIVEVNAVPSNADICAGEAVTFTATPVNGGGSPVYQWFYNNTPVGTNSTTYSNASLNDGDSVFVQLTSSETCTRVNPAFSEPVKIIVNRLDYTKPSIAYCAGSTPVLDLNIPQTSYVIDWQHSGIKQVTTNTDQVILTDSASGTASFSIRFGSRYSCLVSDTVHYTVHPLPVIGASADRNLVKYGETAELTVNGQGAYAYQWLPAAPLNSDTTLTPMALITSPTRFIVTATDQYGCTSSDTVWVDMKDECSEDYVFVPSGFSPNYDGLNDCFGLMYIPPHTEFKLVIFNRWGEKLFEASDVNTCWDGLYKGQEVMIDGYTYVVGFRCYDGTFISKTGTITLLR